MDILLVQGATLKSGINVKVTIEVFITIPATVIMEVCRSSSKLSLFFINLHKLYYF